MSIGGQWNLQESRLHISLLELKAINLALLTFYKLFSLKAAHFPVDNATALSYLMKIHGNGNKEMTVLAKETWKFALSRNIIITGEYLPGKLNVRAIGIQDFSGFQPMVVLPQGVSNYKSKLGYPRDRSVCLLSFPSTLHLYGLETRSSQSGNRCSPTEMKKPGTSICFPPFLTDSKSSLKRQGGGINNDFRNSKLSCTILVQSNPRFVHNRGSTPNPIPGTFGRSQGTSTSSSCEEDFKTNCLKSFNKNLLVKEFQTRLPVLSQIPEDQALQLITNRPGKNGLAGVVKDRLIQLHAV